MSEGNGFAVVVRQVKEGRLSIAQEAPRLLAVVESLTAPAAVKECDAQAAAILAYLKHRNDVSVEEYNAATKLKERAYHRLGEVLAVTVNHAGATKPGTNRGKPTGNTMLPVAITKMQSSRAQQVARLPWGEIEAQIDAATGKEERAKPTTIVNTLLVAKGWKMAGKSKARPKGRSDKGTHKATEETANDALRSLKSLVETWESLSCWKSLVSEWEDDKRWQFCDEMERLGRLLSRKSRELRQLPLRTLTGLD